eukprot:gnl/TRDRNA2_/TRDRNA2_129638_c0_seq2.p1 gnl/TRDRNA2_/TRDRNA2_129638_c0~~gnl/TRDRNA2_/TRDRNA2_129638_c0_seq2.p1  ORF type:complete len:234 (+),score=39.23 gnl/TRDRNA2_/TRDRNA2_129638_c0_seq2:23-703(+)
MSGDDDGQRPDEQIYVIQAECHSTAARQLIEKAPEIDRFLKQKLDEVILSFAANSADELSQGLAPASYHALAKAMWAKVRHESEAQTGMLRTLSDWFKGCVVGRMGYVGVAQCFCFEVRIGATCETFWLQLLFEESSPVRPAPANTSRSIQRKSKFSILSRMFRPATGSRHRAQQSRPAGQAGNSSSSRPRWVPPRKLSLTSLLICVLENLSILCAHRSQQKAKNS